MEQEDLDCEPPASKKKKKRDKVTADLESDHRDEATDMNGNGNVETSPKKTKNNSEENAKVRVFTFLNLISDLCLAVIARLILLIKLLPLFYLL